MKTMLIVGATSAMAFEVAKLLIKENFEKVILVGRNKDKLSIVANDLYVRSGNKLIIASSVIDFSNPCEVNEAFKYIDETDVLDTVLIAHGKLIDNNEALSDYKKMSEDIYATAVSPILFLEKSLEIMKSNNFGHIAIIGSVAGDRGRLTNYIYGASKGFIDIYVQGVQHKLKNEKSNINLTIIKPGPTKTPMTDGMENKGKLANVESVALDIVKAIKKEKSIVYTPSKWRFIMLIIKHMPMFIFKYLKI